MLTPSPKLVLSLGLAALAGLVLGLTTDVGLFGWALGALLVLYLCAVGVTRLARPT